MVGGVSAIVLAAGSSTRMGTPKPLVPLGGTSMLGRVLSTLTESSVDDIVVVLGHSAQLIQDKVAFGTARAVINARYQEGMASSLQAGLASLRPDAEAALIVLVDQPFLQPTTINHLIEEYRGNRPEIVIPIYRGFRGNPVLIDRSVFGELAALEGDMGCRAIFGNHTRGILKVVVEDAGVLVDLDTAADVQRFEKGPLFEQADLSGRDVSGPQLVVVGQDAVARALVEFARLLAFHVVVVDPFLRAQELPGASILRILDFSKLEQSVETFVVVTSRGLFDEEAIEEALQMNASYIALVASKKRAEVIRSALREKGVAEERLTRICAPAGLPIGAVTPAEIAVSIMAEALSKRQQKQRKT